MSETIKPPKIGTPALIAEGTVRVVQGVVYIAAVEAVTDAGFSLALEGAVLGPPTWENGEFVFPFSIGPNVGENVRAAWAAAEDGRHHRMMLPLVNQLLDALDGAELAEKGATEAIKHARAGLNSVLKRPKRQKPKAS